MSVQYYDFEDNPIKTASFKKKPNREFRKEEKYYKIGGKKTVNPDFNLDYAKNARNDVTRAHRMRDYPPLADLADALYWFKKGDSSKMDKYICDCDKVKEDNPFL